VREVFDLASHGATRRSIVQDLTTRSVPGISRGLINHMLPSRFYIGEIPVGRTSKTGGADSWLPGVHEPLIDRETFDAVQRHAQENRKGAAVVRNGLVVHPLSGLGRCGRCGSPMHCQTDHGKVRLMCSARHDSNLCDQVSVLAERIEPALLDALNAYAPPPDIARRIAEELEGSTYDAAAEERDIEERKRRLREVYLTYGQMADDEYRDRSLQLDRRLDEIRAKSGGGAAVMELADMLHNLPRTYMEADGPQRNRLAGRVFRELLIDNQEMVAVRVRPAIDAMLRARADLLTLDLARENSSVCRESIQAGDDSDRSTPPPARV
jgi:Recombinase zinc beta ribbon domain/Recombinase